MYTKSIMEQLTEKLAEELSPEQLDELTRLCEGVYDPAAFNLALPDHQRIVACGQTYAESCDETYNEGVCMQEGRFDWGDCTSPEPYSGSQPPGVTCTTHVGSEPYKCTNFECGDDPGETFSCSASTGHKFECAGDFECHINVTCYENFTCEEFDCENYHGCAEGYTCPDEFECKGDAGFTCGEGVGVISPIPGGDAYNCDATDHAFGCGYVEDTGAPHGNFECRNIHNCPAHFTCFLQDTCGTSPQADEFTCGIGTEPPTGYFYCAHRQQCTDEFQCANYHACGNGYDGSRDEFTCGNGSGGEHSQYECDRHFTCDDVFDCKDVFHCPDYFTCGDTEYNDKFTCGTGEEYDEFTCGDGVPPDYFACLWDYTCDANHGCGMSEEFLCTEGDFECNDASGTFTCGSQDYHKFACDDYFHCDKGTTGQRFECPDLFSCYDKFMCGSGAGTADFNCGTNEVQDLFTCGTDDFEHADEFGCYSPVKFTCSQNGNDAYHCPGGPSELYNCTQMYTCDNNAVYECNNTHPFSGCPSQPPHECNGDPDAVFRCTNPSKFSCQTGIEFSCPNLFACVRHDCTDVVFECGTGPTEGSHDFRCDERYECISGFTCRSDNGFECQSSQNETFSCNAAFTCEGQNSHRCALTFECVTNDETAFTCVGTYSCPAGVSFECGSNDPNSPGFQCTDGQIANFNCNGGELFDFMCNFWRGNAGFECNQVTHVEGFVCATQHVFFCTGEAAGDKFDCVAFTCRPHGICTDIHKYSCGGSAPYQLPGDFGCNKAHDCTGVFKCETTFPGEVFSCPIGGFECESTSFSGCEPADRFSPTAASMEGTYNAKAKLRPYLSHDHLRVSTVQQLIDHIQKRSQIAADEARGLVTKTLRNYFKIDLPSDLSTRLEKLGIDLGVLFIKLGYSELQADE